MNRASRDKEAGVDEPVVRKAYYSIGEVCDITGLKPHVLRYWETQFGALRPNKNKAGNRVYRPAEVELILLVKHLLYSQKYTIEGANRKIAEMRRAGMTKSGTDDLATPTFLSGIRDELERLRDLLTPDVDSDVGPEWE